MFSPANNRPTTVFLESPLAALFLLVYPLVAVVFHGGASGVFLAAAGFSLVALAWRAPQGFPGITPERGDLALCIALAGPLAAVIVSSLWHGHVVARTWDSPSRFLAAVPLLLVLRRHNPSVLRWADLSFAIGAYASFVLAAIGLHESGYDRIGSPFMDPIHFGDISLAFGVLSVLSLNWWRKDSRWIRVLKIGAFVAGLGASLLSGSRGGWVAVPFIALVVTFAPGRNTSWRRNGVILLAVVVALAATYMLSSTVRNRMGDIPSDLASYSQGDKDTSVGIRLQLYNAGLELIERQPVFGLGDDGFQDAMKSLAQQGQLTPVAAQFGRGEMHNQLLAYTANYGLVGGVMLLGIYLVPIWYFWLRLRAPARSARKSARMGLVFVVSFLIFGMTVETFDLKSTVSFYAAVTVVLAAAAAAEAGLPARQRRGGRGAH